MEALRKSIERKRSAGAETDADTAPRTKARTKSESGAAKTKATAGRKSPARKKKSA